MVVGQGVEGDAGKLVGLPSLVDGPDPGLVVYGLVLFPHASRRAVHHHVHLLEQVVQGPLHLEPGLLEVVQVLRVRGVQRTVLPQGGGGLVGRPGLGHSHDLHVVLPVHSPSHPLADGAITVYPDLYLHVMRLLLHHPDYQGVL
jgi:hypothetical protein